MISNGKGLVGRSNREGWVVRSDGKGWVGRSDGKGWVGRIGRSGKGEVTGKAWRIRGGGVVLAQGYCICI